MVYHKRYMYDKSRHGQDYVDPASIRLAPAVATTTPHLTSVLQNSNENRVPETVVDEHQEVDKCSNDKDFQTEDDSNKSSNKIDVPLHSPPFLTPVTSPESVYKPEDSDNSSSAENVPAGTNV